MTTRKLNKIKATIAKESGATLTHDGTFAAYGSGCMASYADGEIILASVGKLTRRMMRKLMKQAKARGCCVGFWIDGGRLYADLSRHFIDKAEAIAFGKRENQIAIYDIAKGESVYLK